MYKMMLAFVKKNLIPIIIASIVLRIIILLITPRVGDVVNAHSIADNFLKTGQIYGIGNNPYPPVVIFYYVFALYISRIVCIPFLYISKLLPIIADMIIIIFLYKALKVKEQVLLFAFN